MVNSPESKVEVSEWLSAHIARPEWLDDVPQHGSRRSGYIRSVAESAVNDAGMDFDAATAAVRFVCGCNRTTAGRHVATVLGLIPDRNGRSGGRRVKYTDQNRAGFVDVPDSGVYCIKARDGGVVTIELDGVPFCIAERDIIKSAVVLQP